MTNRWQFWIAIATVTAITSVADVWTGRTVLAAISAWACGAACVFAVTQAERHG